MAIFKKKKNYLWTLKKIRQFEFILLSDVTKIITCLTSIFQYLKTEITFWVHQVSSVAQSCLTLCDPMNRSMPGLPVHHRLPEFTQINVHWVSNAIQPSHPLPPPYLPALSLFASGSFPRVSYSLQVAKVLQLQHQSFQWIFRVHFL